MKRIFIAPALLPVAALDALKRWLAIGTDAEDEALTGLLRTSLDMCEAFTCILPLESEVEELLPATRAWQKLATRPVNVITGVTGIPAEGSHFPLAVGDYEIDLTADGGGSVRLLRQGAAGRVAVRFTAGLAPDWEALPEAIRHGIIRLAAHHYRERDGEPAVTPPAAVTALWQPWRRMELT